MEFLPSSIEAYLEEAGFSGTELLILKKLLEAEAMTLRHLGLKTGKSTGVLDQAIRKLLKKGIVNREVINDAPMYALHSVQSIKEWMDRDMREKQEMLLRKHRNFESFVNALSHTKGRPDMEYFDGEEGIIKAYRKLMECGEEIQQYLPAIPDEADPLQAFHTQCARERRRREIKLRVIAHDTPLGMRYQSRDPFEFRETVLIPPGEYPFALEQVIAGDTVACFDHAQKKACFVRYPQLAQAQHYFFEQIWKRAKLGKHEEEQIGSATAEDVFISIKKHTLSTFEYMMINTPQKISLIALFILIIFWQLMFITNTTGGFYNYLYSFLYGLVPLFSGAFAMFRAKIWHTNKIALEKAVFFIGLGIFLWGSGETIWSYYNFFLGVAAPYPSLADFAFIPGIFFYGLGTIYLYETAGAKFGLRKRNAKVFAAIAPFIMLVISYYVLIVVARNGVLISPEDSVMKMILDIVYPFSDFLILTIATVISGLSFKYIGGRYTLEIIAILLGLAVMFIGDFIFSYTTIVDTFYNGDFGELIYTVGLFLLSFGVLGFSNIKES